VRVGAREQGALVCALTGHLGTERCGVRASLAQHRALRALHEEAMTLWQGAE